MAKLLAQQGPAFVAPGDEGTSSSTSFTRNVPKSPHPQLLDDLGDIACSMLNPMCSWNLAAKHIGIVMRWIVPAFRPALNDSVPAWVTMP